MGTLHQGKPAECICVQVLEKHARSSAGVRLVAGNTGPGVYKDWPRHQPVLVSTMQV